MTAESADHLSPEVLRAFAEGRLGPQQTEAVERHLLACESCCLAIEAGPEDDLVGRLRRAGVGSSDITFALDGDAIADFADRPPAPPGYEIIEILGQGGMGAVYAARQVALNRVVALKVVLAGAHASAQHRARFLREAEAAAGVGHPNVVHVYETGTWAGQPYLALEHCPGGTLADRLRGVPLPPDAAAGLVENLARALQAAHDRGVVHRDLKPHNILLAADGTPKVADFGLAKLIDCGDGLTATGAVMGTPSYMSPEQAIGTCEVGPAADVYALGAILYECLTGRPPFRGPTPLDTVVQVLEREPRDPWAVSPAADRDLSAVALKCLEKDPAGRYPSAAALADDLGRWQRGEPVTARRRRGLRWLAAWARREPGLAVRLVALAVCAAIIHLRYRISEALTPAQHLQILTVLAAWAAASFACQALLRRGRRLGGVARLWLGSDAVFLTVALTINRSHDGPLITTYGLFVVASGLWLRVDLVRFATAVAVLAYAALVAQAAAAGDLHSALLHHLIAVVVLVLTGAAVAYQVRRVRLLQRYLGHDPAPDDS